MTETRGSLAYHGNTKPSNSRHRWSRIIPDQWRRQGLQQIIQENFPQMKERLQLPAAHRTPDRQDRERSSLWHVIVKTLSGPSEDSEGCERKTTCHTHREAHQKNSGCPVTPRSCCRMVCWQPLLMEVFISSLLADRDCCSSDRHETPYVFWDIEVDYFMLIIAEENVGDVLPPLSRWVWRKWAKFT